MPRLRKYPAPRSNLSWIIIGLILFQCQANRIKTEDLPMENHLAGQTSPYLLQHVHNPVDWYPWGEEAFRRARAENKPIFLSIGYSTCHGCHVMAHESFGDSTVAAYLNEHFICLKVDREERPDIDQIYMSVAQAMTGRGGWPLTIAMTPDQKPFFAGTYFPKESRGSQIGLLDLLPRIVEAWENRRDELEESAGQILQHLQNLNERSSADQLGARELSKAVRDFQDIFDPENGGFGHAPKFPSPHNLVFLLRESKRTGDRALLDMVRQTLLQMRLGGIYDQVGFGFHRYSTDAVWHLPHFEKMLYDQAMLLRAYTEAWQQTGEPLFAQTADEIVTYLRRDMQDPTSGLFYAAEDADSEGEEGLFYTWTLGELGDLTDAEEVAWLEGAAGVQPEGNFRDEVHGQPTRRNILDFRQTDSDRARENVLSTEWETIRRKLEDRRETRVRPGRDTKLLIDWNGLVIASLAYAGRILGRTDYVDLAQGAAETILTQLAGNPERLSHLLVSSDPEIPAFLDDYAFLIWGLRELYASTFDLQYLKWARDLQSSQLDRFWDQDQGGFWFRSKAAEQMIQRMKDGNDGAYPAGNSIAATNLFHLGRILGNPEWEKNAIQAAEVYGSEVQRIPRAYSALLWSVQDLTSPFREIVLSGDEPEINPFVAAVSRVYDPFRVILWRSDDNALRLADLAEFTRDQVPIRGEATAYVCRNYACETPITDLNSLEAALAR